MTLPALIVAGDVPSPRQLTANEQQFVRDLGEKTLKDRGLWKGKTLLTTTEVVLDTGAKTPERYAILTYYRYDGNLGILVTVNLATKKVTNLQEHPDMPTSLTAEEIAEADKLARANADLQKALARYKNLDKIEADTTCAIIIDSSVPGFRHRVARMFFRDTKGNYLQLVPAVDVDLTTGAVRLDSIAGLHEKK